MLVYCDDEFIVTDKEIYRRGFHSVYGNYSYVCTRKNFILVCGKDSFCAHSRINYGYKIIKHTGIQRIIDSINNSIILRLDSGIIFYVLHVHNIFVDTSYYMNDELYHESKRYYPKEMKWNNWPCDLVVTCK